MNAHNPPLTAEFDAALQWWRMAGVDHDFAEDATDWLGNAALPEAAAPSVKASGLKAKTPETPQPPKVVRSDLLGPNPPTDLDQFRQFWLEAPGLDTIGPRGRVPPRGKAQAELMVMVIDPEEADSERLLSGPQGRLLERILAAMGIAEESVYFASALPRHTPMADTAVLAASGIDKITQFHVNLVSPQRLLAFGSNVPPFLGHELTNDVSSLREINQNSRSVPLMVSEGLDSMMSMPRLKARFWRRWMEWSADQ